MSEVVNTVSLKELAIITMGQSPDSRNINGDEKGLPFLQGCAEFGKRYPQAKVCCNPPLRIAKKESTLISVRAPVGTTNQADQDYCIGRGLGSVLAKPDCANDVFLLNAIQHNLGYLHRRSQGSTFLAIGSNDLLSMPVAGPKIEIQRRIAEILSTIDQAIEQTEALIKKTQQIKAGLMHDLFTRGVLPNGQLRPPREQAPELYKDSPLGWVPKEWGGGSFGNLCNSLINGGTPLTINTEYWKGTVPWVTGADFTDDFKIGKIRRHITKEAIMQSSTNIINKGEILLLTRTGVGKLAIAPFDIAISQDITGIILNKNKCEVDYFYYYLQILVEEFKKMLQGTSWIIPV